MEKEMTDKELSKKCLRCGKTNPAEIHTCTPSPDSELGQALKTIESLKTGIIALEMDNAKAQEKIQSLQSELEALKQEQEWIDINHAIPIHKQRYQIKNKYGELLVGMYWNNCEWPYRFNLDDGDIQLTTEVTHFRKTPPAKEEIQPPKVEVSLSPLSDEEKEPAPE